MSNGRALYTYSELEGGGQLHTRWPGDGEQLGESEQTVRDWERVKKRERGSGRK